MLKKLSIIILALATSVVLVACSKKEDPNTIRVGTISGPETALMETAKDVALQRYGLKVEIVPFSDYTMPNVALNDHSIDANMFQHVPYLNAQVKDHGYKIGVLAKTFIYPMGLYSKKIKTLSDLKDGDKVAIPNDPSNEARALLLLQKASLITLKPGATVEATPVDIASNPKHLQFIELDAPQLPRALSDVALAAINTTYAIPAGLSPAKDALAVEDASSPYANVIVVRADSMDNPKLKELVSAFQSKPVVVKAQQLFGDGAVAAWGH